MEWIQLLISGIIFLYNLFLLLEFTIGFASIRSLNNTSSLPKAELPKVSIILSALNEEATIEASLLSMINCNYPSLEIIAVNDRSEDRTGEILNKLQQQHKDILTVFHLDKVPSGWLGKNYALQFASEHAKGEWVLFTDADVFMKPGAIAKSISYAIRNKCHHLTLYEHHIRRKFSLKVMMLAHYVTYTFMFRPWRIRYKWSKKFLGRGPFNLVKKNTYFKCGGHKAIAMECLDDTQLGWLIKSNGFKQDIVDGRSFVEYEWYASIKELIKGWQKNCFPYFKFRKLKLVVETVAGAIFFYLPIIGALFFRAPSRWINLGSILLFLAVWGLTAKRYRIGIGFSFFYPISIMLNLFAVWSSMIAILKQKGVYWRGTYYSLEELKRNQIKPE